MSNLPGYKDAPGYKAYVDKSKDTSWIGKFRAGYHGDSFWDEVTYSYKYVTGMTGDIAKGAITDITKGVGDVAGGILSSTASALGVNSTVILLAGGALLLLLLVRR